MTDKRAALKPEVELQPHQRRIADLAADGPLRTLLVHSLGSGKSLSGIAAAEAAGGPYTAVVPASLRPNYEGELDKFTDRETPADVISYTAAGQGKPVDKLNTIIADEVQRLRNPDSAASRRVIDLADRARNVVLLSGTPLVNRPGDLAVPLRLLTGKRMTPDEFESRYVTVRKKYPSLFRRLIGWSSGTELSVNRPDELKGLLRGHVDYHDPGKPVVPTNYEDVPVDMSPEQTRVHEAMWDKLPWWAKWKLRHDVAMSDAELRRLMSFLTGPRQVGLSTYPFLRDHDPIKAFEQSNKLKEAMRRLQQTLKDDRAKALVFANFVDAGLTPYSAALTRAGVPNAVFHGGLSDRERKKLVDDYNAGRLRVALLGPSGTEGLSFKGTQAVQLLDEHFQPVRGRQAVGRGLRYDSHWDLPEELRHVNVQRFRSRLPLSFANRALSALGFDRSHTQLATDDHLARLSRQKAELNQRFLDLLREVGSEGHR